MHLTGIYLADIICMCFVGIKDIITEIV